jgi:predicted PurR-regulated permease PerM
MVGWDVACGLPGDAAGRCPQRERCVAKEERGRLGYGFVAKATMVALGVWALAFSLWLARDLLFIAFLAVLLAIFLSLFVDPLERVMPRPLAAVFTMLLMGVLAAAFFFLSWPSLQAQLGVIQAEVPRAVQEIVGWVEGQVRAVSGEMRPTEEFREQVQARLNVEAVRIVAGALPLLNTLLGALVGAVLVVFAGFFLVMDPRGYLEGVLRLVPPPSRDRLRDALLDVGISLRRWMAGMSVAMLMIFATTTIGLWLLGVPAPLALGLIAGILNFIPFVGPILSAIPAIALALTVSTTMVIWVSVLYLVIQQVESNALIPVVMRRAVRLRPALTLLFQMVMAVMFGFLGLVVAVPLLAAIRVLVHRLYIDRLEAASAG